MIGNCRAAAPLAGGCSVGALCSTMPSLSCASAVVAAPSAAQASSRAARAFSAGRPDAAARLGEGSKSDGARRWRSGVRHRGATGCRGERASLPVRFVESIIHEAHRPAIALRRAGRRSLSSLHDTLNSPTPGPIAWPSPARQHAFEAWLQAIAPAHALLPASLRSASSDASFRRYFRVDCRDGPSFIVMDAPPPQEDVRPFVEVAALIAAAGLHAPRVLEQDVDHGFLLLTDLGAAALPATPAAGPGRRRRRRASARDARRDRRAGAVASARRREHAAALRRRAAAARAGAVSRLVRRPRVRRRLDAPSSRRSGRRRATLLVDSALAQPQVAVHRDYMPRNLMVARAEPRHPRLPGRGARPDHLRRRLAAARRVHLVGRGAGARLGGALLAGGAPAPACRSTPTSASSGASSNGWACSAT